MEKVSRPSSILTMLPGRNTLPETTAMAPHELWEIHPTHGGCPTIESNLFLQVGTTIFINEYLPFTWAPPEVLAEGCSDAFAGKPAIPNFCDNFHCTQDVVTVSNCHNTIHNQTVSTTTDNLWCEQRTQSFACPALQFPSTI